MMEILKVFLSMFVCGASEIVFNLNVLKKPKESHEVTFS